MDLNSTMLSSLLKHSTKHTHKVTTLLSQLIEVTRFTTPNKKLIIDEFERLVLTSQPSKIYLHVNLVHPVLRLLVEDIERIARTGDSGKHYVRILRRLLEMAVEVMNCGVDAKKLARIVAEAREQVEEKLEEDAKVHTVKNVNELRTLVEDAYKRTGNIENVRVCKVPYGSSKDNHVLDGLVIDRVAEGRKKEGVDLRCVVYNCALDVPLTETKGVVQFKNAEELLCFNDREETEIRRFVMENEVDVVFCHGQVGSLYKEMFDEKGVVVFKVQSKYDLMRVLKMTGAKQINSLNFDSTKTGTVTKMALWGDEKKFTLISCPDTPEDTSNKHKRMATVVVGDCLMANCDEVERDVEFILKSINGLFYDLKGAESTVRKVIDKIYEFKSDQSLVVLSKIKEVFDSKNTEMVLVDAYKKSFVAAFQLVELLLLTDDFFMTQDESLKVRPQENKNWDEQENDICC